MTKAQEKAIVLLGHGSKKEDANNILKDLAKMLEKESEHPIYSSFLQFTSPTLEDTIEEISKTEVNNITVVPVFLFPGIHLTKDIPKKIDELKEKYPSTSFQIADPIGADERLVPILKERAENSKN
ncbi:sirohydrochlorin chelatase [Natranaerofaba carboxydovora]|uniref:sirohydrochlorin chelatase n=1 Tax=Natranaerofaba carboxydovora TaxID=2742683 RepID=UPI001F12A447|nr:CbiX/SirB N-terminal domain-containing protein [Natranaerofaba carboxydovora]UMZ73133.1 Sirohydrochlorin cobaltochelatase [Natranaerofaba carboxydovora]